MERSDGFFKAFVQAFMMIMVTELGDETFIIAALLAMRNGRLTVYSGELCSRLQVRRHDDHSRR